MHVLWVAACVDSFSFILVEYSCHVVKACYNIKESSVVFLFHKIKYIYIYDMLINHFEHYNCV